MIYLIHDGTLWNEESALDFDDEGLKYLLKTAQVARDRYYNGRKDVIFVTGHGLPGSIATLDGPALLEMLIGNNVTLDGIKEFYILSCDSAVGTIGTRLIDTFAKALRANWVIGAAVRGNLGTVSVHLDETGRPTGLDIEQADEILLFPNGTTTAKS